MGHCDSPFSLQSIYNLPNEAIVVETGSQQHPSHIPKDENELESDGTRNENICSGSMEGRTHVQRSVSQQINVSDSEILDPAPAAGDSDADLVLNASNASLKLKGSSLRCFDPAAVDPVLDDSNHDSLKPQTRYDFSALPFADPVDDVSAFLPQAFRTRNINLSSLQPLAITKTALPLLLRIVFFVPWCVAVGGMIVMYPRHLDLVAFSPVAGYITPPPTGIRRFTHWSETAMQHVWIFLGFLASVVWLYPVLGWMLVGGVAAQSLNAWWDFRVDRSVELGEDDRQTVYLVLREYGCPDELMEIGRKGSGYVVWRLDRPRGDVDEDLKDEGADNDEE
jgi:hypothetical protein